MESRDLEQALRQIEHPEPSAQLDARILGGVKQRMALENYHKAEQLLVHEGASLDQATRVQLATAMVNIREQFGPGFEDAYGMHQKSQSSQPHDLRSGDLQR